MIKFVRDKEIEKKIIDYLVSKGAKRIELFGSYVRGGSYNDIDVIVEFDKNISLLDFIGFEMDLEEITGKKIDLLTRNSISKRVYPFVERDKDLIYER
ncbi:MAG: hypothetical protein GXO62_02815 [Epsilonproteobacteria bacterium]|nr:hypothetical protein [Campylobacterota bacterium]